MSAYNHTAIATGAAANASTIENPIAQLDAAIGDKSTLTTTDKSAIVLAINEVMAIIGALASLATTAKTSIVAAINEIVANIGSLPTLTTTDKTKIVNAINEVNTNSDTIETHFGVHHSNVDGTHKAKVINSGNLADDIQVGSLAAFLSNDKSSVQNAFNELFSQVAESILPDGTLRDTVVDDHNLGTTVKIGSILNLLTQDKTNVVSAINEEVRSQTVAAMTLVQNWRAQIAKIQNVVAASKAVIGYAGDDWVEYCDNGNSFLSILRYNLQTKYGSGGAGWVSFAPVTTADRPGGIDIVKTGTWEDTVNNKIVGSGTPNISLGPCLRHTRIETIDSPIVQTLSIVASDVNTFAIHFWTLPGGGDFRYNIDSGTLVDWITVTTDNAAPVYAVLTISGLPAGSHNLMIEPVVAGSAGIILIGVDVRLNANGVVLHNLGCVGATSEDWADCNQTALKEGLTQLGLHTFVLEMGMNEFSVDLDNVQANQETLIAAVNDALPLCDVVLVPEADNGFDGPTLTGAYSRRALITAYENSCVYFSLWDWFGLYSKNRGLYDSTTLLNYEGARVAANLLFHHVFMVD